MPRGRHKKRERGATVTLAEFQAADEHSENIEALIDNTALSSTVETEAARRTQIETQAAQSQQNPEARERQQAFNERRKMAEEARVAKEPLSALFRPRKAAQNTGDTSQTVAPKPR